MLKNLQPYCRLCLLISFMAALSSCVTFVAPKRDFSPADTHPPDYSRTESWASLPEKKDNADLTPDNSGLQDNQQQATADVFFIHPTTYNGKKWNTPLKNKRANKRVTDLYLKLQAGIFNESCKVYVPHYRQATLYSFVDTTGNGKKALDLAYGDVKNAFEYYLEHYNNGRPVIIAGHSQGTTHAIRLLKEFFDNKPSSHQLVAAYLVGMPVYKDAFKEILPCDSAGQTGCYVSWLTFGKVKNRDGYSGKYKLNTQSFEDGLSATTCTNPLSWKNDTMPAENKNHLGSVPFTFNKIDKELTDAQCMNGILWITSPEKMGYPALSGKNYHLMDYNLFYMNIRQNIKTRLENYFSQKGNTSFPTSAGSSSSTANQAAGTSSIAKNATRIIGKIVSIDTTSFSTDEESPCSKLPCKATVLIEQVIEYGSNTAPRFAGGNEIMVNFTFTLSPTKDLFPGMKIAYPGLKTGSRFIAEVEGRMAPDMQKTEYRVYHYEWK